MNKKIKLVALTNVVRASTPLECHQVDSIVEAVMGFYNGDNCQACGVVLTDHNWAAHQGKTSDWTCRPCRAARGAEWRANNREHSREYMRNYMKKRGQKRSPPPE